MLTISKLKRWSIKYYIDTAQAAEAAARSAKPATRHGYWPATPTPPPSWSG
jgi:hypothetical protein